MKPRIMVITLGVDDLERALRFYRYGLGLPTRGIVGTEFEHGAVAFFDLQHGLKLAICPAHLSPMKPRFRWALEARLSVRSATMSRARPKWMRSWPRSNRQARRSPIRRTMHSGVATRARSRTPMGTCGRWCGTRRWKLLSSRAEKKSCQPRFAARGTPTLCVQSDGVSTGPSGIMMMEHRCC